MGKTLSPEQRAARFWVKVRKTDTCWIWTASTDPGGYGKFVSGPKSAGGRLVGAHRWAYEALVGPIPEGLTLDHLCRVRACVRPDHLEVVSLVENIRRGNGGWRRLATHCRKGHPYSPENTYLVPKGSRQCRTCARAHKAAYRQRRRDAR